MIFRISGANAPKGIARSHARRRSSAIGFELRGKLSAFSSVVRVILSNFVYSTGGASWLRSRSISSQFPQIRTPRTQWGHVSIPDGNLNECP